MILEEAQNVVAEDSYFYQMGNRMNPLAFSNVLPSPIEALSLDLSAKPIIHKAAGATKKRTWKKPIDKPKRPLSAYNLFFKEERERILASISDDKATVDLNDGLTEEIRRRRHRKTHGKIGFADLARSIADQWKQIDSSSRSVYVSQADIEKSRYKKELDNWTKTRKDKDTAVVKKVKPAATMHQIPEQSLSFMMSASSMRNQIFHQQLIMQHQALLSQQQQMEALMGLPSLIQQQQQRIMMMNQQNTTTHSNSKLPMMSQVHDIPHSVEIPSTSEDYLFAPDVSFSSNNFFDDEPLTLEHQSVVTEESDLSSLEDDLTNFMNDFEAGL